MIKEKLSKIIKQVNKENAPPDGWKPEDRVLEIEQVKKEADELMMKKIEHYEKEIALVREDAQIERLRLEKINNEHQKLNGELQVKLSKYEDKAAHYRRKAVL